MFNEYDVLQFTVIMAILLSIIGSIVFNLTIGLGLLLGGLIGYLAFRLLIINSSKLLRSSLESQISRKEINRLNWGGFLKRCSLYAGALTVASLSPYLNFLATLIGLLLPILAINYLLLVRGTKRGT